MKILYHHRTASNDGQAVHIEELTAALKERGHEVVILGPGISRIQDDGATNPHVLRLRRYLPKVAYEALEFLYTICVYLRLARAFRAHRPDILYERASLFCPAGVWVKRRFRVPLLLEVNAPLYVERCEFGGIALKQLARWSETTTWRGADIVLPVSKKLSKTIRRAGVPKNRIEVVPNGTNLRRFTASINKLQAKRRLGLPDGILLGFTGFTREWNALDKVLNWLANSRLAELCYFLVVGDGPARLPLEKEAEQLGIRTKLIFTGHVPRHRITHFMTAFDVALLPGVRPYASPLKVFEYMALGKAIVAPRTGNICEILQDEKSAALFDPCSHDDFVSTMDRVVASSDLRDRLGDAARRTLIQADFTWERNARRVELLANGLLSSTALARAEEACD